MSSSKTPSHTTTTQDLPPWAQALGPEYVNQFLQYYTGGPAGTIRSYSDMGGAYLEPTAQDPVEDLAQQDALARAKAGSPMKRPTDQFYLDQMSGAPAQMARSQEAYFLGGPAAGATRESLLSQLMGRTQGGAENQIYNRWGDLSGAADQFGYDVLGQDTQMGRQAVQSELFGGLANRARQSVYGTLSDQDLTRGTEVGTIAGALANQARSQQQKTIAGDYLDPATNPYLNASYDAAARAMSNQYRYATAPSTAGMFAQAGTFGGSAHRQLKSMQEFEFGQNLSDLAAQMYGQNYQQERQAQIGATQGERGYTQQMLDAMRNRQVQQAGAERQMGLGLLDSSQNRQYQLADQTSNRALQSAMQERNNWQQTMMQERQLEAGMTGQSLDRNIQLAGLLPSLMSADYIDLDVRRQVGRERRDIADVNRDVNFQNRMRDFEWQQKVIERLGGALGAAGGQGQTQMTSSPASGGSPWATYAALAPVALSTLWGGWGNNS